MGDSLKYVLVVQLNMALFKKDPQRDQPSKESVQISAYANIWNQINIIFDYFCKEFEWSPSKPDQDFVVELKNIQAILNWSVLQIIDDSEQIKAIIDLALSSEKLPILREIHETTGVVLTLSRQIVDPLEQSELTRLLKGFFTRIFEEAGFETPKVWQEMVQSVAKLSYKHGLNTITCYLCDRTKPWNAQVICKLGSPHSWGEENRNENWKSSVEQNDNFATILALAYQQMCVDYVRACEGNDLPNIGHLEWGFDVISYVAHVYRKYYRNP